MKVLLLGASGLLGHNVLHQLVVDGHQAKAVVRQRSALAFDTPEVEVVEGQITDRDTVLDTAEGCDAIINCAGVTNMGLLHRSNYAKVNQNLCQTLIEAMNTHGISRLVHVSTVNTIGNGTAEHPADESANIGQPFASSFYADTKLCGETIVRNAASQHPDWHMVVVNPGFMLGPMDVKPSSGRMLLLAYRKRVMFAPRGGKAFVDVRDVATAVVNALTMGKNGDRYIAVNSHGNLTISELYKLQSTVMGYRQHVLTLPNWILCAAGAVGDTLRTLGVKTEVSTINVRQLMVREYYDNSHAVSDLLMPETDIAQSILDFHAWRENNKRQRI